MPDQHDDIADRTKLDAVSEDAVRDRAKDLFREKPKEGNDFAKAVLMLGGILAGGAVLNSLTSKPTAKRFRPGPVSVARDFGEAIRLRRKDLGLTQIELAQKAGTGDRLVGEIENGKETAEVGKVLDLLDALGLEVKLAPKG